MKLVKKPICIIIYGAQASGKGTQAIKIADDFNLQVITTGDLIRIASKKNNKFSQKIKKYYNIGKLIPDKLMIKLIQNKTDRINMKKGIIIDCFPRNVAQIKLFENLIKNYNFKQILAIYLDIKKETSIKRISNRKVCRKCQTSYKPMGESYKTGICEKCGGKLIVRSDDNSETLKKRLDSYYKQTMPVLKYFEKNNNLLKINGEPAIESVYKKIVNKLKQKGIIL